MKKLFKILTFSFLILTMIFSAISVAAENSAIDIEDLIKKCNQLPTVKTVSLEHKDLIVEVKMAYDTLDIQQKAQLGSDNLAKISEVYAAFEPLLLGNIAARTMQLPEKVSEADKENVVELYNELTLLSEEAKASFGKEVNDKLIKAVKEVAPELLGEQEASKDETTKSKSKEIFGMFLWEFIIIAILVCATIFYFALIAIVAVKVIKK